MTPPWPALPPLEREPLAPPKLALPLALALSGGAKSRNVGASRITGSSTLLYGSTSGTAIARDTSSASSAVRVSLPPLARARFSMGTSAASLNSHHRYSR